MITIKKVHSNVLQGVLNFSALSYNICKTDYLSNLICSLLRPVFISNNIYVSLSCLAKHEENKFTLCFQL